MSSPISVRRPAGRGLWLAALAGWSLAGAGCTQSGTLSAAGGSGGMVPVSTPAQPCTRPLGQSECAPTFDEQDSRGLIGPFCNGDGCCTFRGACGDHKVWLSPPDLGGYFCVYDKAGATLLASSSCSDIPLAECRNGSNCITAGAPMDSLALCDMRKLPRRCFFDSPERRARTCAATLDDARPFCRATLSEQTTNPPPPPPTSFAFAPHFVVGECGDTLVWAEANTRASCIYGGDGQLVGAQFCGPPSCPDSCNHAGPPVPSPLECTLTETILDPPPSGAGGRAP